MAAAGGVVVAGGALSCPGAALSWTGGVLVADGELEGALDPFPCGAFTVCPLPFALWDTLPLPLLLGPAHGGGPDPGTWEG